MELWLLILMIGIAFLALVLKIIGYMCTVKDIQSMSSWWWFVFMYILKYHYSFPDSHVDIERNRTNNVNTGTHSNASNSSPYIISMHADEVRSIPRNDSDLPPSYCQVEERPPSYEHYQRQNKLVESKRKMEIFRSGNKYSNEEFFNERQVIIIWHFR